MQDEEFERYRRIYLQLEPERRNRLKANLKYIASAQPLNAWLLPILCFILGIIVILAAAIAPPADNKGQVLFDSLWLCIVMAVFAYAVASRLGIFPHVPREPLRTIAVAQIFAIIALGICFPLLTKSPFAAIMFVLSFTSIAMFANAITALILSTTIQKYRATTSI
jgi:hypothetical protein